VDGQYYTGDFIWVSPAGLRMQKSSSTSGFPKENDLNRSFSSSKR